jgi:hypothetical protein
MSGIVRSVGSIAVSSIGLALGGPWGAAAAGIGFELLFPQAVPGKPGTTIPDLFRDGAEYGAAVKQVFGLVPMSGDAIDCGINPNTGDQAAVEIVTTNVKQKGGTGKGAGGATAKEETGYLTVALLLAMGPVYVEQMLVTDSSQSGAVYYDRYNSADSDMPDPQADPDGWRAFLVTQFDGSATYKPGVFTNSGITLTPQYAADGSLMAELSQNLRFYAGTEYQVADSTLAAIHGSGAVPYRGQGYVMLNSWGPLNGDTSFEFHVRSLIDGKLQVIRKVILDGGYPENRIKLNSISGKVIGCARAQVEPPRQMAEQIAASAFHDLSVIGPSLHDISRLNPATWVLQPGELGARVIAAGNGQEANPPSLVQANLPAPRDRPTRLVLQFLDADSNLQQNQVVAERDSAGHENTVTVSWPFAMHNGEALRMVDVLLDELWAQSATDKLTLLPNRGQVAVGNLLIFDPGDGTGIHQVRVNKRNNDPMAVLSIEAQSYDPGVYGIHRVVTIDPSPRPTVQPYQAPDFAVLDLPALNSSMQDTAALIFAAAATPWGGAVLDSNALPRTVVTLRAVLGTLLTDFSYTEEQAGRFNYDLTIRVQLVDGELVTATEDAVRDDANQIALGNLLVSYVTATPVSGHARQYDLSGIWPGRYGTDYISSVLTGATVVVMTDEVGDQAPGLTLIPVSLSRVGTAASYEVQALPDPTATSGTQTITPNGNSLRPSRVNDVSKISDGAGGYILRFHPRTRDFESANAFWVHGRAPREIDPRRYTVVLLDGVTEVSRQVVTWPDSSEYPVEVTYTAAALTTMFGSVPDTLSGSIWHEGTYLRGQEKEFEV